MNEEIKFYSGQVSLTAKDRETLFHIVGDSQITDEEKERLQNKLGGFYLNDETMDRGLRTQKANKDRWKKRMDIFNSRIK